MSDNEKAICNLFIDQLFDIGTRFKTLSNLYNKEKGDLDPSEESNILVTCALNLLLEITKKKYKSNMSSPYFEKIIGIENIVYVLGHIVYQTKDGGIYINSISNSNINQFESILLLGMTNQIDYKYENLSSIQLRDCGYTYLTEPINRVVRKIVYNQYLAIQYDDNLVKITTSDKSSLPCEIMMLQFDHQLDHYELFDIVKKVQNAFLREEIINKIFDENHE